jgi:hypothetical protein
MFHEILPSKRVEGVEIAVRMRRRIHLDNIKDV